MSKRNNILLAVIGVLIIIGSGILGGYIIYQNSNKNKVDNSNSNNTSKEVQALYDKYKEKGYTEVDFTKGNISYYKVYKNENNELKISFYPTDDYNLWGEATSSLTSDGELVFKSEYFDADFHTGIKNIKKYFDYDQGNLNYLIILTNDGDVYKYSYYGVNNSTEEALTMLENSKKDIQKLNSQKKYIDIKFYENYLNLYASLFVGVTADNKEYILDVKENETQENLLNNFTIDDVSYYYENQFVLKNGDIYINGELVKSVKSDFIIQVGTKSRSFDSLPILFFIYKNQLYSLENHKVELVNYNNIRYVFMSDDKLYSRDYYVIFADGTDYKIEGYY